MNLKHQLDKEFSKGNGLVQESCSCDIEKYRPVAEGYAEIENTLCVLSDLKKNISIVCHSRFSRNLDIDLQKCTGTIPSKWEDGIFRAIHPDDLEMKLLQELLFFHYISSLPEEIRYSQCLMQRLRIKNKSGGWTDILHRLHYIPSTDSHSPRLAICLYGAMPELQFKGNSAVLDTSSGRMSALDSSTGSRIFTRQETNVIRLIDSGNSSREISEILNISIHTVNRHRQNIIAKLNVRNSAEACKIARNLGLF